MLAYFRDPINNAFDPSQPDLDIPLYGVIFVSGEIPYCSECDCHDEGDEEDQSTDEEPVLFEKGRHIARGEEVITIDQL